LEFYKTTSIIKQGKKYALNRQILTPIRSIILVIYGYATQIRKPINIGDKEKKKYPLCSFEGKTSNKKFLKLGLKMVIVIAVKNRKIARMILK